MRPSLSSDVIFLDTSFVYALADEGDPNHERAKELFRQALESDEDLLTHNYILVESVALLQSRLRLDQALRFLRESEDFHIHWVTPQDHRQGVNLLKERGRRGLSLVDCVSFVVMRRHRVREALAFDPDFEREGFKLYKGRTKDALENRQ